MNRWKTNLELGGRQLAEEVKIKRGIFQRSSLSLLLFAISLSSLRRAKQWYNMTGENPQNINYLLYMDDLKLYSKGKERLLKRWEHSQKM